MNSLNVEVQRLRDSDDEKRIQIIQLTQFVEALQAANLGHRAELQETNEEWMKTAEETLASTIKVVEDVREGIQDKVSAATLEGRLQEIIEKIKNPAKPSYFKEEIKSEVDKPMKARLEEAVKETVEKATSEAGEAQKTLIEDAVNKAMKRLDPRDTEENILGEVKALEAKFDDRMKEHSGRIAVEFERKLQEAKSEGYTGGPGQERFDRKSNLISLKDTQPGKITSKASKQTSRTGGSALKLLSIRPMAGGEARSSWRSYGSRARRSPGRSSIS